MRRAQPLSETTRNRERKVRLNGDGSRAFLPEKVDIP
jgi:hypothetical protein